MRLTVCKSPPSAPTLKWATCERFVPAARAWITSRHFTGWVSSSGCCERHGRVIRPSRLFHLEQMLFHPMRQPRNNAFLRRIHRKLQKYPRPNRCRLRVCASLPQTVPNSQNWFRPSRVVFPRVRWPYINLHRKNSHPRFIATGRPGRLQSSGAADRPSVLCGVCW